jgi:hypothetical protein
MPHYGNKNLTEPSALISLWWLGVHNSGDEPEPREISHGAVSIAAINSDPLPKH